MEQEQQSLSQGVNHGNLTKPSRFFCLLGHFGIYPRFPGFPDYYTCNLLAVVLPARYTKCKCALRCDGPFCNWRTAGQSSSSGCAGISSEWNMDHSGSGNCGYFPAGTQTCVCTGRKHFFLSQQQQFRNDR